MVNVTMERYVFLCILLCCALLEVQCLKCYVCDNCEKVKDEELQTCGVETTPESTTMTTTTTVTTIPTITSTTAPEILKEPIITSDTTTEPAISFATDLTEPTTSISTTPKQRTPTTNKAKLTPTVKEASTTFIMTTMELTTPETATKEIVKETISPDLIAIPEISSTEGSVELISIPNIFTTEPEIDSTLNATELATNFTLIMVETTTASTASISEPTTISETVTTWPTVISTSISSEPIENFNIPEITTTESTIFTFNLNKSEPTINNTRETSEPTINSLQNKPDLINTTLFMTEPTVTSTLITVEPEMNFTLSTTELTTADSILITDTSSTISAESATYPMIIPGESSTLISSLNVSDPTSNSTSNASKLVMPREPSLAYITTESANTYRTTNTEPITATFTGTLATTLAEPVAPFMMKEPTVMPLEAIVSHMDPAENDKEGDNLPLRNVRSVSGGCACSDNQECDCPNQRSKRYALRGRTLTNEEVKYICVVDQFLVNGTQIVKRGCATLEEDQITSCLKSGFRANCKTCNSDQCNGSSMIRSSVVFLMTIYFIKKLMI